MMQRNLTGEFNLVVQQHPKCSILPERVTFKSVLFIQPIITNHNVLVGKKKLLINKNKKKYEEKYTELYNPLQK